jgi:hypothetical protein
MLETADHRKYGESDGEHEEHPVPLEHEFLRKRHMALHHVEQAVNGEVESHWICRVPSGNLEQLSALSGLDTEGNKTSGRAVQPSRQRSMDRLQHRDG